MAKSLIYLLTSKQLLLKIKDSDIMLNNFSIKVFLF